MVEHAPVDQRVVDNDVRLHERVGGVQRQEARIARPGADEPDPTRLEDGQAVERLLSRPISMHGS